MHRTMVSEALLVADSVLAHLHFGVSVVQKFAASCTLWTFLMYIWGGVQNTEKYGSRIHNIPQLWYFSTDFMEGDVEISRKLDFGWG